MPNGTTVSVPITFEDNPFDEPYSENIARGSGFYDWLDIPFISRLQGCNPLISANISIGITVALTHISGASCMSSWTGTLVIANGRGGFQ